MAGRWRGIWLAGLAAACLLAPAAPASATHLHVYDVVIDGLEPGQVGPLTTPRIWALLNGDGNATKYEAARALMFSETNPNHVAMATGAYPESSGFVGNAWFDRVDGKRVSGEDPKYLQAETIFTTIENTRPSLVTAGIFGKPKLGRIFADALGTPEVANVAPDYLWIPCKPNDPAPSGATCSTLPIVNPITGYAPDEATMDEVVRVVNEGVGGQATDYMFINLADVDSAGHGFTTLSPLYPAAALKADLAVGRLIDALKAKGLWSTSVLMLHTDHGMNTTALKISMDLRFRLAGLSGYAVVDNGGVDSVYLLNPERPDAEAVLKQMRQIALATDGVEEALYRRSNSLDGGSANTFGATHPAWRLHAERAGDLVITADEGHGFIEIDTGGATPNVIPGNHGHPSTRAIPFILAGGWAGIADTIVLPSGPEDEGDDTESLPEQAENVDAAPTAAWLLGVPAPAQSQGRRLTEAFSGTP